MIHTGFLYTCTCGNHVEGANGNHSTVTPALQMSLLKLVVTLP
jgi:hypothetical protein